ncbi:DUF2341 domain-containing protein [Bermanella marisrubri]|uniref:Uncharacterized protein n=1 Tax=Bermanella marisrubri TaxID=207949 RepID=Q1N2H0_9GAMM|nr:CCXG family PEP-CTERM protein [Bermanella marisrubri]EAT12437.1 hypothetical protein RED65_16406 [Oceanobacter sp. RED65] [Bermanella marisrubri]QIZ85517.1 DUF2341 domain-containing protein [Bermanella marisrubri]
MKTPLVLLLFSLFSGFAEAYWNCAFPYRTTLEIEEVTGNTLTNYQVQLQLNGSRLNPAYSWTQDGQDMRILDSDDQTELEFWIENWNGDTEQASVWVRLPTVSANQIKTIYIYYGNQFAPERSNVPFTFTEPGIKFHSRQNQIDPDSLTETRSLFNLAGDNTAGYGCTIIDEITGLSNSDLFGAGQNFIGYSETFFEVEENEAGTWEIRYASDFGYGGGLYVNGQVLAEDWQGNLWWNDNWSSSDVLSGSIELSSGFHRLEVIGAEDCCDGGLYVQYRPPGEVSWFDYSVTNREIRSRVCPVREPIVRYGAQDTASCPSATAFYRLDKNVWTGNGSVIDQSGRFAGTMQGQVSNVVDGQVCSAARVANNNSDISFDGIQTGVDLDNDIGTSGTIAFWVRYNSAWNATGPAHTLLDATEVITGTTADKYFLLQKESNGRLRWRFEDSSDRDFSYTEPALSTTRQANIWYHIALTFDYVNNEFKLYVNGELVIDESPSTNGTVTGFDNIVFGDNYPGNVIGPGPSSNSDFDEIAIYSTPLNISQIRGLLVPRRSCQPTLLRACEGTFPDGIATTGRNTLIDFGFNSQLINNADSQLSANSIRFNGGSTLLSCESVHCSNGDELVNSVDPGRFQRGSAGRDVFVLFFTSATVGAFDDYDNVTTSFLSNLTFTNDNFDTFYIDRLDIAGSSQVTFEAGTYWINELSIGSSAEINVAEGPVRLYVNRAINVGSSALINSPALDSSGSTSALLLYAYDDVTFNSNVTYSGTIYSQGSVSLGFDAQLYGAVTANEYFSNSEAKVVFDEALYDGLNDIQWCEGNQTRLGSLQISTPSIGINCLPIEVVITVFDTNGDVITDFSDTITLSTSQGHGDWSLSATSNGIINNDIANDGLATYTMSADDNGQVTLLYKNTFEELTDIRVELAPAIDSSQTQFNAAGFVFSSLPPQVAGLPSIGHTLRAVETDDTTGSCQPLLLQDQTVQMAAVCLDPSTCSSTTLQVDGQSLVMNANTTSPAYSDVTLNFGDASSETASFSYQYDEAGLVQLLARYDLRDDNGQVTGNFIQGASNNIVNTPAGFCVRAPEADSACTSPGLSANCTAFKQAGSLFDVDVQAKTYGDGSANFCSFNTTTQFNSSLDLQHGLVSPTIADGGRAGNLSQSSIALTNGAASTQLSITEMGVFNLRVGGNSYLSQVLPVSTSENIGRFFPKDFFIQSHVAPIYSDGNTGFTYTGQLTTDESKGAIEYSNAPSLSILVRGANNQSLQNYLSPLSSVLALSATASSQTLGIDGSNLSINTWFSSGSFDLLPGSASIQYEFSAADGFSFVREQNSQIAPFNNDIELVVTSLSDAQGISLAQGEYRLPGSGGEIRFGRFNIDNAFGVETQAIEQRFFTEYFDGGQFILNDLDNATPYDLTNVINLSVTDAGDASNPLTLTSSTISFVDGNTGVLNNGIALGQWSATSNGEYGRYQLFYDAPLWLKHNWDESTDGSIEDPSAEVSFGQYRGNDRVIYWKEISY